MKRRREHPDTHPIKLAAGDLGQPAWLYKKDASLVVDAAKAGEAKETPQSAVHEAQSTRGR
jgi:hypothetical protein